MEVGVGTLNMHCNWKVCRRPGGREAKAGGMEVDSKCSAMV